MSYCKWLFSYFSQLGLFITDLFRLAALIKFLYLSYHILKSTNINNTLTSTVLTIKLQ